MDTGAIKKLLQDHFKDGLAVVVGSGLSASEGIPGMIALATHLVKEVEPKVAGPSKVIWDKIASDLTNKIDLETALHNNAPDEMLDGIIREETARLLVPAEKDVLGAVVKGTRVLKFSKLLPHLVKPSTGLPIITTNYDRLIEAALEVEGLHVDGLFIGDLLGWFEPALSSYRACRGVKLVKGKPQLRHGPRATVLKPHGSFDWYQGSANPIRSPLELDVPRLIVTPGSTKYLIGYKQPFDAHRERANKEIDKASRLLFIGFGFNDVHLQTHLEPRLMKGTPALVLARSLSANTMTLLSKCSSMIAICRDTTTGGAEMHFQGAAYKIAEPIWDIESFVTYTF